MSNSKHTPGKWVVQSYGSGIIYITSNEEVIANVSSLLDGKNNEQKLVEQIANAKLIAAAPDLLAALEAVCDYAAEFGIRNEEFGIVVNAINKAKQ